MRNVQCGGARSTSCSGAFTSSDGRIQNLHDVDIDVVGSIVIGILLSVLGIAVLLPFLAIGVLMALGRRPR